MREYWVYSCLIIFFACLSVTHSQFGPTSPRLSIPPGALPAGALSIPVRQPLQYRNERLVGGGGPNAGFVRIRRPVLAAAGRQHDVNAYQAQNNLGDEAKPVTEEPESGESPQFVGQFIQHQQQHQQQQQQQIPLLKPQLPALLYSTNENGEILDQHRSIDYSTPTTPRFNQPQSEHIAPTTLRPTGAQRFSLNQERLQSGQQQQQQQPQKPVLRARPDYREPRPQFEPNHSERQQQSLRQPQQEAQSKSRPHHSANHEERERKPVAQILRKYREENEDGTITWGFENDDGSYKEEIIGIDCVTRGRYGYVDPDGVKREYNYETGIACDPSKRNQEEQDDDDIERPPGAALQDNGAYVDYQENQMVLPNGQRINLNNIGRNKSRRPTYNN